MTLLTGLFIGCERRPLEDEYYENALIPVRIDWTTLANLDPDNDPNNTVKSASIWFFPKNGDKALEFRFNNPKGEDIQVPLGEYSVIVINRTIDEFSAKVGFRGVNKYETFEYYLKEDTRTPAYSRSNNSNRVLQQPDILACWSLNDFEVTKEMVLISRTDEFLDLKTRADEKTLTRTESKLMSLTNIKPERLTAAIKTIVHVERLNVVSPNPLPEAGIQGMPSSVLLHNKKYNEESVSHYYFMNNRKLEENKTDGTIEASINVLMPRRDLNRQFNITAQFTLLTEYEGSVTYPTPPKSPFTFNVTDKIKELTTNEELTIYLNVEMPDVIVEGTGGGIDIDIEDWGEEVVIPLN